MKAFYCKKEIANLPLAENRNFPLLKQKKADNNWVICQAHIV